MQENLSLETAGERESLVDAIRFFLEIFKVAVKKQIIAKYFETICTEIG